MRCFIRYKHIARDLWISLNNYKHNNWVNIFNVLLTYRAHNAAQQSVRIPMTILFAQFFDKFNKPKVQWLSRQIGYNSVSKRCARDLSLKKLQGSIARVLPFPPFCHPTKTFKSLNILTWGSILDLIPVLLGIFILPKKLWNRTSCLVRLKAESSKHTREIWFSCILISCLMFFLYDNFQRSQKYNCLFEARFSKNVFEAVQKIRRMCFIGSNTTRLGLVALTP